LLMMARLAVASWLVVAGIVDAGRVKVPVLG
jgi:hypothetical protein